jgi:hypothetical protein
MKRGESADLCHTGKERHFDGNPHCGEDKNLSRTFLDTSRKGRQWISSLRYVIDGSVPLPSFLLLFPTLSCKPPAAPPYKGISCCFAMPCVNIPPDFRVESLESSSKTYEAHDAEDSDFPSSYHSKWKENRAP